MKDSVALPAIFSSAIRKLITPKSRSVLVDVKLRCFSYAELVKMTDNFQRLIGSRGLFGNIYHGELDGAPVAVKLYRIQNPSAATEFQTEVNLLNKLYHKNVIKVFGYYEESTKSALVFEFMANGDLRKNLTESGCLSKLTWKRRLGIAIDMAKALNYLHNGCEPPIIHRDFKSSNILLSENFQARLSGLALAVSFIPSHEGESHMSADTISGTIGYLDPLYMATGKFSIRTDVYGFGAVLMEIITGRPPYQNGEYEVLTQWDSSMFGNGEIGRIVDPKLEGDFDVNSVKEALNIAFACLSYNSNDRPTMGELLLKLKHCLQMETARLGR